MKLFRKTFLYIKAFQKFLFSRFNVPLGEKKFGVNILFHIVEQKFDVIIPPTEFFGR